MERMRVSLDHHLAKRHFFRVRGGVQPPRAEDIVPSAFFTPLGGANIVCWGAGREHDQIGVVWLVWLANRNALLRKRFTNEWVHIGLT